MPQLSLNEWLSLLEARHPTEIELGLDRIGRVASQLGFFVSAQINSIIKEDPEQREELASSPITPANKIITVAGTNGKGSCVAAIEQMVLAAGLRVGCYTSPHFIHYNERISINGQPVGDQAICAAFERIEAARGNISLTYFEFGTLAALLIMSQEDLDVALLEVGLGGRLDAVNILDPDIAVVTSIARDHEDWLGKDLNGIAAEKAAIARPDRPLIYGDIEAVRGVIEQADEIGSPLLINGRDFCLSGFGDIPETHLPPVSVACALQAVKLLNAAPLSTMINGLQNVALPGRFQQAEVEGVQLVLDVAHNPQAAALLAERLLATKCRIIAVVGIMADKDIPAILLPLIPLVSAWYCCDIPEQSRAATARNLAALLYNASPSSKVGNETDVVEMASPVRALKAALANVTKDDTIVVFGSFFTVGPVLQWLKDKGNGSVRGE